MEAVKKTVRPIFPKDPHFLRLSGTRESENEREATRGQPTHERVDGEYNGGAVGGRGAGRGRSGEEVKGVTGRRELLLLGEDWRAKAKRSNKRVDREYNGGSVGGRGQGGGGAEERGGMRRGRE